MSEEPERQHGMEGNHCTAFPFEALVFDVQIYIVSCFVPPQDLKTLTLVSRYFKSIATPALYTNIQLRFGLKPQPETSKDLNAFTERLVMAQHSFSFQIMTHLERANHIRSVAWQVYSHAGSTFTGLFPLLHNLRRVNLIDPHPTHVNEVNILIPPLFPRVEDVRLTGTTALYYVMPILHSPQRLTAISLDTIKPHSTALRLLEWIATTNLPCLRVISLRTTVQAQDAKSRDISRESEISFAWKKALLAVRSTAEKVTLGLRTEYQILPGQPSFSPSNGRFGQDIMAVFLEDGWRRLNALRLEGIDIDTVELRGHGERLRAAISSVLVDSTIHAVPRFWHLETSCD